MTTLLTPVHDQFIPPTRNDRAQSSPANDLFRADLAQAKHAAQPPKRSELTEAPTKSTKDDRNERIDADRDDKRPDDAERADRKDREEDDEADRVDERSEKTAANERDDLQTDKSQQPVVRQADGGTQPTAGESQAAAAGSRTGESSSQTADPRLINQSAGQVGQTAATAQPNTAGGAEQKSSAQQGENRSANSSGRTAGVQPTTTAANATTDQTVAAVAPSTESSDAAVASVRTNEADNRSGRSNSSAEQGDARLQHEQSRARRNDQSQPHLQHQPQRADANQAQSGTKPTAVESAARQPSAFQSGNANAASPMQSSDSASEAGRQFMNMVARADGRGNAVVMPAMARAQTIETNLAMERSAASNVRIADGGATTTIAAPSLGAGADGGGSASLSSGLLSDGDAANATAKSSASREASFAQRVMRGLHAMINQKGGVMNMRLDPPELGSMRIQMVLQQGTVSAQFNVSTDQAQQLLNRNLNALKTALEARGLTVERLTVTNTQAGDNASASRNDNNAGNQAQHHQSGSQQDAGQGMSRGRSDGGEQQRHGASHHRRAGQPRSFAEAFEPIRPSASE